MKRTNRIWLTGICAIVFVLGVARWFHSKPIYAQQNQQEYDDGTFLIGSYVDVDSSYNLYLDSYMEVEVDFDEDIDEIEVDATADQDGGAIDAGSSDGDDFDPAEVIFQSNSPVSPGHEYGLESDGYACFDDGEGDCDFEYIATTYASVSVASPTPQIASITPTSVSPGAQGTLTISGSNFIENSGDQLTLNFSGSSNPFTLTSTPSTCTSTCTATFSYSFSGYPAGSYTLSLANNEGTSNSETFTVSSPPPPPDPCAVTSNSQTGYSSIASVGAGSGSGTMAVSFSSSAYAAMSASVSYGPYSTPSSIASNIAALISKNYYQYGLTARAFGSNIVYSGNTTLGAVSNVITGSGGGSPPFSTNTSSAAAAAAEAACESSGGDSTPMITGIVPNDWASGQTTSNVTISGVNFGSNAPTLGFSPGNGISYSLSSYSDTQIVANVSVASGTPTEEVAVTVTSNGYGGSGFTSGGSGASPTSAPATARVHAAPANSPEITVVSWIDGTAPDIVSFLAGSMNAGVNSTLMTNLNSGGFTCGRQVGYWLLGVKANINTQADVNYVNVWGIAHSPNNNPGPHISPQSVATNPYSYRMFNDYGGSTPNANTTASGSTPDPCQWLSGPVSNLVDAGQTGPFNGTGGTSVTGKQYQVAEVRVGVAGQRAYKTVNSGRTVPWIYSVIEFDSSGNPTYSDLASFPTYSVYQNGTLVQTHPQSTVLQFFNTYDQSNVSGFSPIP